MRGRAFQPLLHCREGGSALRTDFDAVIIGAGPAGTTAAILLAQAGWAVALIEKQVFPRRKVCGECIAAPNLMLMEKLGIAKAFHRLAGPDLRQVGLMLKNRLVIADLPALRGSHGVWGRALGREHLDTLLLQRAAQAGATILQPWAVRSIAGAAGDFKCTVTESSSGKSVTLSTPVCIAACGSWEPQSFMTGRNHAHKAGDLFAFKANFRNSSLQPGLLPVLAFAGGYGGMVLGDRDTLTLACCIRRDALQQCRKKYRRHTAAESVEAYLKASCEGVAHALQNAERQDSWLSVGPIRPGIRVAQTENELLLIGNAAAEAHPIIGEGISMAMQSAWLLCDKLIAQGQGVTAETYRKIRSAYIKEWHQNFASRLRLAALFAHIAMRPYLSSGALTLLHRWPDMLTYGAHLSGKVRPLYSGQLQGKAT